MGKQTDYIRTTGTWVELKRERPHGKLTQDCIRNLRHTGTNAAGQPCKQSTHNAGSKVVGTSEFIKPNRKSLASSKSQANTAAKKGKRFLTVNGQHDYKLDKVSVPGIGHKSLTAFYQCGPVATDASNGIGLASRIKARD